MATERRWASSPSASAESHGGGSERGEARGVELQRGRALHEVEHAKPRGVAGAARRGQHVVRAGHIIADHLRRVAADKDGAGVVDACGERIGVTGGDLQMLGREPVGERRRLVEILHQNDGAELLPARPRRLGARQQWQARPRPPAPPRGRNPASSVIRIACAAVIVLGLSQQVGGDPCRVVVLVGDHHHLRRPGHHVDADLAEHLALGRRHIGVARARRS